MLLAILALMTAAAVAAVLVPLLRRPRAIADTASADMRIYREQLGEIQADQARGLIGPAEAEAARREIERRLLRAYDASAGEGGAPVEAATAAPSRGRRWVAILALGLGIPATAGLIYARLGSAGDIGALPWAPSFEQREIAQYQILLHQLETKVKAEPSRPEGWMLLGRMYSAGQRYADAADAFGRAAALRPGDADPVVAEAEAQIMAAGGTVTPQANALLRQAVALDPHNAGARFYVGLAQWQNGEKRAAYATWQRLADEAPADAPWLPEVRARLREMAASLGIAPEAGPSAEQAAEAARMDPQQRAAMIRGMVEKLAARLERQPDDLAGWMRLGRSYTVLGDKAGAVRAFERARALAPKDPDVLVGLGQARAQAGDRAGALAALAEARAQVAEDDPRRDQIEQTMRALQPAGGDQPDGAGAGLGTRKGGGSPR